MITNLLRIDDAWFWFLLDVGAKATILLLVAALLNVMARRGSAALRHRIWALAFVALWLLPLACLALPGLAWPIIPIDPSSAKVAAEDVAAATGNAMPPAPEASRQVVARLPEEPGYSTLDDRRSPMASPAARASDQAQPSAAPATATDVLDRRAEPAQRSTGQLLLLCWFVGAVLFALPLLGGIVANSAARRRYKPAVDAEWGNLIDELSQSLGLRRSVTLHIAAAGQMPTTFGCARPAILLPANAVDWSPERTRIVLLHELAHIQRYDVPWQMVARAACAIYWFHPLAWWALRKMRVEREHACDDRVLVAGQKPSDYASELLEVARCHHVRLPLATAALSMARRSQLEGRLLAVLDPTRARAAVGRTYSLSLLAATFAVVFVLGVIRPATRGTAVALAFEETAAGTSASDTAADRDKMVVKGVVLSPNGRPVAGAQVELLAASDVSGFSGWPIYRPRQPDFQYLATSADGSGRFRVTMRKLAPCRTPGVWVFASAAGLAPRETWIDLRQLEETVELKLFATRTVRVQLIDAIGNPLAGMQPELWSAYSDTEGIGLPREARALVKLWPTWTVSDAEGYTSTALEASLKHIQLLVEDERVGRDLARFEISDEPTSVVVREGYRINGSVTAADTGQPLEGAEVVVLEPPYPRARTQADGTYSVIKVLSKTTERFVPGEVEINVYPPADSAYLFLQQDCKLPADGGNRVEFSVKLPRGLAMAGRIVERGSQRPVAGARVWAAQQEYGNPLFRRGSRPNYTGTDMVYMTDVEGRFHMPVWPGPGYLLVSAPTLNYVHVMVSEGAKYYGKPGLERQYFDGAARINFAPGETPPLLTIELERGVTLKRTVLRPDGQPATGVLFCRSYLVDEHRVSGYSAALPIKNGRFELSGFAPEASNPLFLFDPTHHCGLTMSPGNLEVEADPPPIRLLPCGSAKFRIVDEQHKPRGAYEPRLQLVVTPGAPATHYILPDQPLWSDSIIWENVLRYAPIPPNFPVKLPRTDADGNVVVEGLIPEATYNLGFVGKQSWDEGYDFQVHSGQTTDVGEVVIPDHQ